MVHSTNTKTGTTGVAGSPSVMLRRWLLPLATLVALGLVAWVTIGYMKEALRREVHAGMNSILRTDIKAVSGWIESQRATALAATRQPAIHQKLTLLLDDASRALDKDLSNLPSRSTLDAELQPLLSAHGVGGYAITDAKGRFIAGVGERSLATYMPTEYFEKLEASETAFIPPHRCSFATSSSTSLALLVIAAIREENELTGTLTLVYDPSRELAEILKAAWSGQTGDAYLVSSNGLMLSSCRFEEQLRQVDLLGQDQTSALSVTVRNPGGDLMSGFKPFGAPQAQPMTVSAAQLSSDAQRYNSQAHVQLTPYRDYRGVNVVGAYQWLPAYGMGLITEVSSNEAYGPLRYLEFVLFSLIGLLTAAVAGLVTYWLVTQRLKQRIDKTERKLQYLGEYELLEKIGAGGMGEVYRARHALLRRDTAIKLLRPGVGDVAIARFEREVQMTSQLANPNTIQIFDYGRTPEGIFYYAMEYLSGIDLSNLVKRFGPLPDGRVQYLLLRVCESLSEAHTAQLIHRDIKPSNIMITCRGGISDAVKVLDFGLVRHLADANKTMTIEGNVAGTPAYMSPEATQNPKLVDARSDIYSLGCVAYYLLSGQQVFVGTSPVEVCWKQVRETARPLQEVVSQPISDELVQLVMKCLAKDPADRPQTIDEFRDLLDDVIPRSRWSRKEADKWWAEHRNKQRELAPVTQVDQASLDPTDHSICPPHTIRAARFVNQD